MLIFFAILFGMLASTLLWMRIASRQLLAARLARWRWAVWIFGSIQLLAFALAFSGRLTSVRLPPWKEVITPVYLWFLIIAPGTLVLIALADVLRRGIRLVLRWFAAPAADSQPVRRNPSEAAGKISDPSQSPAPAAPLITAPAAPQDAQPSADQPLAISPASSDPPTVGLSRRRFLALSVAALPPLVNLGSTAWTLHQLSHFRIRHVTLPFASLPAGLDGFRIALLADIHCGQFTRGPVLDRIVQSTQSLDPDIILFAGDLIDFSLDDLPAGIATLRQLRAPYGVHCIEGNHDLFQSRSGFEQGMARAGLPLLLNQQRTIRVRGTPLQLLGLKWGDENSRRGSAIAANFRQMITQRDPEKFGILLTHHPDAFDLAAEAGIPLSLAGHTHGGQLMLTPHFGAGSLMFKYYSGLYQQGDSSLFVSNGVGNWFPLRFNAPAEIVHITLKRQV